MPRKTKKRVSKLQLSEDIIVEILSRLPGKALLRFKCVCKSWNSLISKPNFRLSAGRERVFVSCIPEDQGPGQGRGRPRSAKGNTRIFYSLDDQQSILKLPNPVGNIPFDATDYFKLLGTCNGLILFCASRSLYLWNPLTRCCKELSQLNGLAEGVRSANYGLATGFCFDKTSDDYKVVLVKFTTLNKSVYVASLRKKETWTDISFPYKLPIKLIPSSSGVSVRGHLHWLAKKEMGNTQSIVFFDEKVNQFNELPMPEDTISDCVSSEYYFGLTVLHGYLCICKLVHVGYGFYSDGDYNHVSIMREYGVKPSWTKLFTIRGCFLPLHARISDDLVLVYRYPHMYIYDLAKRSVMEIKVQPSEPPMKRTYNLRNIEGRGRRIKLEPYAPYIDSGLVNYVESLESIPST